MFCNTYSLSLGVSQTAVSTFEVQRQPAVESAPTNPGFSKAQTAFSTKPGTKTAHHEVRTVVANASDFDRQDVTGVISLDEVRLQCRSAKLDLSASIAYL
jgi:hypothetical protein